MKTSARLHAFLPHLILILGALTPPIGRAQWERTALDSGLVSCFIVDNSSLFAGTSTFGGVYRTRDFGKTWAQVNNGLAVLANPVPVIDMAVSQSGKGKVSIFAGAYGGVFISADDGSTWTARSSGLTYDDVYALATYVDDSGNVSIIAGTASGRGEGVFRSTDSGISWADVSNELLDSCFSSTCWINALVVNGSMIFAGSTGKGVFRSTNNGESWAAANTGMERTRVTSFALSGSVLFAGSYGGGVYRSTDVGATWSEASTGLTNLEVSSLAVAGDNLFAGTLGGGVFLSTNGGTSWVEVNEGLSDSWVFSLAAMDRYLFAGIDPVGGVGGGVWRRPLSDMVTGIPDGAEYLPKNLDLTQNYPNPFNPSTAIDYWLPHSAHVRLAVYDLLGQEIALLVDQEMSEGAHTVQWNGVNQPSGVYFYQLVAGKSRKTNKLVIMR